MGNNKCINCVYLKSYNSGDVDCYYNNYCKEYDKYVEYKGIKKSIDVNDSYPKEEDKTINPDYYSNSDIDVIEYCNLNKLEFWIGNVLKYCVRAGKKSIEQETDDLKKAIRYIERRIEFINRK